MKHKPRPQLRNAVKVRSSGLIIGSFLFSLLLPVHAQAQDLEIHGFLSQGYLKSTGNNYLAKTKMGSWEFAEGAINFATSVTDELSMGMQFFTRELGSLGNFNIELDWAFGDYAYEDWLSFRVGRIKNPYGLYGEIQDFDIVRATVLLPQSVYYLALRDLLVSFNGVAVYGYFEVWDFGSFDYQLFGGSLMVPKSGDSSVAYYFESEAYDPDNRITAFSLDDLTGKWMAGGALKYNTPIEGLLLNASAVVMTGIGKGTMNPEITKTLETVNKTPDGWTDELIITFHETLFWVASAQYTYDDFVATGEYAGYLGTFEMSLAPVTPHAILDQERWYVQAEYRFSDLVQAAFYYSYLFDKQDQAKVDAGEMPAHGSYMKDWSTSLRFDLTDAWLLKLEFHYVDGTAQVYAIENQNHPDLQRFWTLFAAKTTVTF